MTNKAFFLVILLITVSLSGCLRDGKGDRNDEPVISNSYDVLVYEDIVYASGLAHSKSSTESSAVSDVGCILSRHELDRQAGLDVHSRWRIYWWSQAFLNDFISWIKICIIQSITEQQKS